MTVRKAHSWGFVVIWEFRVRPGMKQRFLRAYGPDGEWAKLFSRDKHYLGTELVQRAGAPRTYLTLDFWTSSQAYRSFRKFHAKEYKKMDSNLEILMESERKVGAYSRLR
jgi:heme-degrading monooxygenase HmoA